jgi:hypothetical protein
LRSLRFVCRQWVGIELPSNEAVLAAVLARADATVLSAHV